ncbi:hypothetical protein [Ferviditalea candida]|uniref:Uncharacterized protein n=1 Tax=Ferviditalea candida TaxID=3108399 RepID=A0ABU5ZFT2_9BACL|nr:hypothetical protein [Paenibacillaceae bacterium T2]
MSRFAADLGSNTAKAFALISRNPVATLIGAFGYHTNLWEFVKGIDPETPDGISFPIPNVFF